MSDLSHSFAQDIVQICYFITAFLFIFGLKKMSSPSTARKGLSYAVIAMFVAVVITYFHHEVQGNYIWMTAALFIGGSLAYVHAKGGATTEMPKMVALYNGLGGGAAAAIVAVELIKLEAMPDTIKYVAVAAALIGSISLSASVTAFAKLQGLLKDSIRFPMQQWVNALILVVALTFGVALVLNGNQYEVTSLVLFFILALVFGVLMTIRLNDSDIPVLISLLISFSGLAIALAGYVLLNPAMMIAGSLTAATGVKLTLSVTKAMSRSISLVLFGSDQVEISSIRVTNNSNTKARELQTNDAAMMLAFAKNIIIVPGYGMAIAQAQYKVWEMCKLLKANGANVKFAVHPVAGRMPGHMNVLLSEAGIPYDSIYDIDEINGEFESTDVVLLIGANDTTNTSARTDKSNPNFGMPILNADQAKNIIVIKRGEGSGFSNIDNPLFYQENTGILYGDAQSVLSKVVSDLKKF